MQSTKPYLIRALHEWCVDQGFTPYLSVAVDATTRVPREFVKNGEIVFNIGLEATNQLHLGNDEITFQGRFGGRVFPVIVPVARVAAIYARENSQGMTFEVTEETASADKRDARSSAQSATAAVEESHNAVPQEDLLRGVSPAPSSDGLKTFEASEERPTSAGRPTLTRVK
jgi:stringent starvation protein B